MAIRSVHIEGFGHFRQASLGPLGDGLVVLHGPNEAGKTTLSSFLLYVLFGPERGERLAALDGGRLGGRLALDVAGEPVELERFDKNPPVLRRGGGGPPTVEALIAGVDRALYRAVYAFSLDDLRSFADLGEAELRERLFTGSVAGAGRSVSVAVQGLARRTEGLWRQRSASRIRDLEAERGRLSGELDAARRAAQGVEALQREVDAASEAQRAEMARRVRATEEARRWRALIVALPHHEAGRAAERELASLPAGIEVPAAALEKAERLEVERSAAAARLEVGAQEVARREAERGAMPTEDGILDLGPEIERLMARAAAVAPFQRQERAEALADAEARLRSALGDVGLSDEGALLRLDLSAPHQEQLRHLAQAAIAQEQRRVRLQVDREVRGGLAVAVEQRRAELEALPKDAAALAALPRVEALRRDHPGVESARQALRGVEERRVRQLREVAHLEAGVGPHGDAASADLQARGLLAVEVTSLLGAVAAADAKMAHAEAQVETSVLALGRARDVLAATPEARAEEAGVAAVVAGVDRAIRARDQGADAAERAVRAEAVSAEVLTQLGGVWGEASLARARTDAASIEGLRAAARVCAAEDALADARRREVELLREEAGQAGFDADTPFATVAEAEARLDAIEEAELALRALDEQLVRAAPSAAPLPRWMLVAGVALGVVLVLLGLAGVATGAVALGVAVVVVGLVVLIVTVAAFLSARSTQAGAGGGATVSSSGQASARAALAALGLPPTAGRLDLQRLRVEAQRGRSRAELKARFDRARAGLEEGRRKVALAHRTWQERAEAAAWPATMPPEQLDGALTLVLRASDARAQVAHERARAQEAQDVWTAWAAAATPVAAGVGLGPPRDGGEARALVEALRRAGEAAERAREARVVAVQAEAEAVRTLALAEAQRDRARSEREALASKLEAARGKASALGVPAEVELPVAARWLEDAARLRELRAGLEGLDADAAGHRGVIDGWAGRFAATVPGLATAAQEGDALEQAWQRCRQAEAWHQVEAEAEGRLRLAEAALRAHDGAQSQAEATVVAHAADEDAWRAAVEVSGWPSDLAPGALDRFLDGARRARDAARDVEAAAAALRAAEATAAAFVRDVGEVVDRLGEAPPREVDGARAWLQAAVVRVAKANEGVAHAARAAQSLEAARVAMEAQGQTLREAEAGLRAVLATYGVERLEALREAADHHARRARTAARAAAAFETRNAALGREHAEPAVHEALDAPDLARWETAAALAEAEAERAAEAADAALERRTTRANEIQALRGSGVIAEMEIQRATVETQLAAARAELAKLVLARALLERTLARFREAHQPQILRTAGAWLATVTRGAYVAIEPEGDGQELVLVDRHGGRRQSGELSRGTAEALYLVLRLSLARETTSRDHALPLLLDDVLVNLDPERAEAVADLLAEVSRERQVLLLTCRPETRDLLQARVVGTQVVELPRFAGRDTPVSGVSRAGALFAAPERRAASDPQAAAQAVLRVLGEAAEPLGKDEILRRAGLTEPEWAGTIRVLRDSGRVVQSGERRGAKYQLVDGGA